MRKYLILISLILLPFLIASCNKSSLIYAMADFDQAFIPVFYSVYVGDLESAEKAMVNLNIKWAELNQEYEKESSASHNWQESFHMIDAWLADANSAIINNDSLQALLQLDHARYELIDLRWREGIRYHLDKVWDLEATIDIVVETTSDPMLDLMEWEEFIPMCYDVERAWILVIEEPFQPNLFQFSENKLERLEERKQQLGNMIDVFMTTVECADSCKIHEAAKAMEVAYLNYLYLFGDFQGANNNYALN